MYPFERFTEMSKQVLTLAQEEAERSHRSYIGTEHLLLGLMRVSDGVAAKALQGLGLEIDAVRSAVDDALERNERIIIQQIIPTTRVKLVIETAFEEARRMGDNYVGTQHLLIALLMDKRGTADVRTLPCGVEHHDQESLGARVLNDLGVTLESAVVEVERLVGESGGGEPESAMGPLGFPGVLAPDFVALFAFLRHASAGGAVVDYGTILAGVMEDPDSLGARALAELGVTSERLGEVIARLRTEGDPPPP